MDDRSTMDMCQAVRNLLENELGVGLGQLALSLD